MYILYDGHVGPMLAEHPLTERVDFAEADRLKSVRALKPKREASYAAEQIQNF
jgi:hypothetical protein